MLSKNTTLEMYDKSVYQRLREKKKSILAELKQINESINND